mgnify:CR=1 FL=1
MFTGLKKELLIFCRENCLTTLKPKSRNSVRLRLCNFGSEKGHLFALTKGPFSLMLYNGHFSMEDLSVQLRFVDSNGYCFKILNCDLLDVTTLKPKARNSVRLRLCNFGSEKGHLFPLTSVRNITISINW